MILGIEKWFVINEFRNKRLCNKQTFNLMSMVEAQNHLSNRWMMKAQNLISNRWMAEAQNHLSAK